MLGVRLFVAVVVGVSVSLVVSLVGVGSVPVSAVGVIGPGGRRCFEVVGSPGDAAVVNLTPVLAQGSGNGLLVSSDVVSPPVAANVNYRVGSVDPNVAIVPIGADGEVCYVNARRTGVHLVADHLGTIAATAYRTATSTGGPERVADTRSGGGMVGPGGRRCFEVVGSPGDAAVVNLTPVLAQGSGNGLLVSSDVVSPPVAANVNYRVGSVDPNVAIVPIGADGEVCYVNARRTGVHLVADHLGTIAATAYRTATSTGGPERVADTRSGGGMVGPGGRRCFEVVGSPGDAAVVNLTPVLAQGSGNGLLVSSDVVSPPVAANVNYRVGSVDPNVAIVPIGADGEVCYVNARRTGVHLVADHLGTIAATAYRTATLTGAPQRVTDTRPPLQLVDPQRGPTPTGCVASTLAETERVSVDPRVEELLAGVNWSTVDALTVRRLAATVMAYSGPLPAAVGKTAAFDDWVQQFLPTPGTPYTGLDFWNAVAGFGYHETVHAFQAGVCAVTGASRGYSTPRLGPAQSDTYADVRARVTAIIPDADDACRRSALRQADNYLTGPIAEQALESQLWEINAYVLDMEYERALLAVTGTALWGADPMNIYVESAKLHQLARYLELTRATPGLWAQMRAQGVDDTVADHWNLAVSTWRPLDNGLSQRGCWDLAFGPDAAVIGEFTSGLAGNTAPPRP